LAGTTVAGMKVGGARLLTASDNSAGASVAAEIASFTTRSGYPAAVCRLIVAIRQLNRSIGNGCGL
jgi:hypothetical protein